MQMSQKVAASAMAIKPSWSRREMSREASGAVNHTKATQPRMTGNVLIKPLTPFMRTETQMSQKIQARAMARKPSLMRS